VARWIALVLVVALVAGCGGSSRKTSEKEIRRSVLGFLHSLADGNANKACSLLTARGRKQLFTADTKADCVKTVGKITSRQGAAANRTRRELRGAHIAVVTFKSDTRAEAAAQLPTENAPTAPFNVVKRGDRWLIDGTRPGG
jgi:hypothetical protein